MSSTGDRPPLLSWSESAWDRWSSMPRMSSGPVPRTKFLLLKAPASSLYEEKFGGDRNMFTVSMYAARMMAKRVQVGCVVDCTALDLGRFEALPPPSGGAGGKGEGGTVRYFHDTSEWDDFDIEYHRLELPTSDATSASASAPSPVPPAAVVERFLSVCSKHWSSRPGTNIALFDSRGGYGIASYMIARYMCEKMRAPVHVALASLKDAAKPCGLADVDLVKDLQVRYKGRREVRVENLPAWWWPVEDDEEDEDDDEEEIGDGEKVDSKRKKNGEYELVVVIPPFDKIEGGKTDVSKEDTDGPAKKKPREAGECSSREQPDVPGLQALPADSQKYERAITVVQQLTSQPCSKALPFCQEVMVTSAESLPSVLANSRYKVTWRSRGRRGLLLILTEGVYFLEDADGKIAVSTIKGGMHFPLPTNLSQTQHRTLLDGVLVLDKESGATVPRYYASDILCHTGGILTSKPFGQRLKYLLDGVIMARKRDTKHDYGREAIKIRAKEYFELGRLSFVLREVMRGVAHGTDGVVLVPLAGSYFLGKEEDKCGDKVVVWGKSGAVTEERLTQHVSTLI